MAELRVLMARTWKQIVAMTTVLALLTPLVIPAQAQGSDPITERVAAMSPEERVGQLFIVTFLGRDPVPESDVARLILEDKVGGVVLLASNGNVHNQGDTPGDVLRLTNALQTLALSPDGGTLATSSTDATVRLWSFPQGQVLHTLTDRKKTAASVCWSADGAWVGTGWYGAFSSSRNH